MKSKENRPSQKIIIVPDEHGRGTWKNGLKYFNENPDCKMIFLGDYLDPYTRHDGITHEDAYKNFLEILEFTRANPLRVILLIGNHDEYYRNREKYCCRHDNKNYYAIAKLFEDNKDLFQYAYKQDKYLFTHAGVCDGWLKYNNLDLNEDTIVDYLNSAPNTLWQVGYSRGGRYGTWGSPIWNCWLGDWYYDDCKNPFKLTQIIGHTNVGKHNYPEFDEDKDVYMFDVQNSFLLDTETGEINLLS